MVSFTIQGKPVPQPRHKISTIGGHGRAYIPGGHAIHAYKKAIQDEVEKRFVEPLRGEVIVKIRVGVERPKSHIRKDGQLSAAGKAANPIPVGDSDNYAKAVLDALTDGGAYIDDRQVTFLEVHKSYEQESFTTIEIKEWVDGRQMENRNA